MLRLLSALSTLLLLLFSSSVGVSSMLLMPSRVLSSTVFLRAGGTRYFGIGERSVVMDPVGLRALWSLGFIGFPLIYIAFF